MNGITNIGHDKLRRIASKRSAQAVFVLGLMLLGAFLVPTLYRAKAVHNDNLFELGPGLGSDEGGLTNILGDGMVSNGPDWSDLFTSSGTLASGALATFGGTAAAFLSDDNSQKSAKDNTVFVVSSKNQDPLSAWSWGTSSVPPKDEFLRAYAYASVNASNSHLVIYAGLERLNGTGSSHVDFQFFQDQVHLVNGTGGSGPPCADANKCSFAGTRIIGDVLVGVDYTTGGTFPTLSVFKWDGSTFVFQGSESTGCNSGDTICGFTNAAPINEGPWSSGHIDANDFTEFGVDVTGLFGSTPCISTVFGATRSTGSSITGTLKDFAGPTSFPICHLSVKKTATPISKLGDTVTYTYNVTNDGSALLFKKSIIDSRLGDISSGCGVSLAAKLSCVFTRTHVVNAGDPNPLVNVVTATYNSKADFTGVAFVATDTASVTLVHPNYTLFKTCSPVSVSVGDPVTYTFVITNTGDVGLVRISVMDTLIGDITSSFPATLAPSASATIIKTRNAQSGDPNPIVNNVTSVYGLDPNTGLSNQLTRKSSCSVLLNPFLKITGFGYTNTPNGFPTGHTASGTTTYTVTIKNFGPTDATVSANLSVSVTLAGSGTINCSSTPLAADESLSGCNLTLTSRALPANMDTTFTLVVVYTSLANGAVVRSDLSSTYTGPSGSTLTTSGSPATITFTIVA